MPTIKAKSIKHKKKYSIIMNNSDKTLHGTVYSHINKATNISIPSVKVEYTVKKKTLVSSKRYAFSSDNKFERVTDGTMKVN